MSELLVDVQRISNAGAIPTDAQLAHWAQLGYQGESAAEVTVRLVDEAESADLNLRYRGKDRPTNVLSFPFEAPAGIPVNLLGDLVICAAVVMAEAKDQQKSADAHWAHMVIHGMLHLQDYDHETPDDAGIMEALEIRLLSALGFSSPYLDEVTETHS